MRVVRVEVEHTYEVLIYVDSEEAEEDVHHMACLAAEEEASNGTDPETHVRVVGAVLTRAAIPEDWAGCIVHGAPNDETAEELLGAAP